MVYHNQAAHGCMNVPRGVCFAKRLLPRGGHAGFAKRLLLRGAHALASQSGCCPAGLSLWLRKAAVAPRGSLWLRKAAVAPRFTLWLRKATVAPRGSRSGFAKRLLPRGVHSGCAKATVAPRGSLRRSASHGPRPSRTSSRPIVRHVRWALWGDVELVRRVERARPIVGVLVGCVQPNECGGPRPEPIAGSALRRRDGRPAPRLLDRGQVGPVGSGRVDGLLRASHPRRSATVLELGPPCGLRSRCSTPGGT